MKICNHTDRLFLIEITLHKHISHVVLRRKNSPDKGAMVLKSDSTHHFLFVRVFGVR